MQFDDQLYQDAVDYIAQSQTISGFIRIHIVTITLTLIIAAALVSGSYAFAQTQTQCPPQEKGQKQ